MTIDTMIALSALLISICSLAVSVYIWRRSFRPIVTAAVKTHASGSGAIVYDLIVMNSGSLPGRNIQITATDTALAAAFGHDATAENKERWLAGFKSKIDVLQNGDRLSCSFGTTKQDDAGFWRANARIPITVIYQGWFGGTYKDEQVICVADSDSFTGYAWGKPFHTPNRTS